DYVYEKIDIEKMEKDILGLLLEFEQSNTFEQEIDIINRVNSVRNHFETMHVIVSIRYSMNTTDVFYEKENEYMDEISPIYESLINKYYKTIIKSKFRSKLEEKYGKHFFNLIDVNLKTFSDDVIVDLQNENKLNTSYRKLRASAKILFDGEERNLSQMVPFTQSVNRDIRIKSQKLVTKFFIDNEKEFDEIYDKLVKLRHKIAIKLGYDNFIKLAYDRLGRTDYDNVMVENYRLQVFNEIVPIYSNLRKKQAKRLKFDSFMYYDEPLNYLSGNAMPKGNSEWILENGKKMYSELSKETNEFFNFMLDRELLDLESKKGKSGGGYCTFINEKKAPFIFSNFNGTSGDIDVLTHEAGHAFQVYMSRNYELPEYTWPTLEACEIHSMSMEFLTWPWMESFFKEDTKKYKFSHLSGALLFIPYGVTVDEFQHYIYKNPNISPNERKRKWREIEKKYMPNKDYGENDFLNNGGFWFRQGHIFTDPFYYIDYTLAQICAFEFFNKANEDRDKTWSDYLELCKAGGSKSFLDLLKVGNLNNPFEDGTIKKIVRPISKWLEENNYNE
ncbi:MAG: M3 family oligoendopeptidase, partial [Bacillota bacterium]|nr:M3 family oligoendopeptidase [Bacillota bacterium]